MATGAGQVRWNSKVRAFLENLTTKSLDELMQVSGQLRDGAIVGNRVLGYISRSSNGRKRSKAVRPCCEQKSQKRSCITLTGLDPMASTII